MGNVLVGKKLNMSQQSAHDTEKTWVLEHLSFEERKGELDYFILETAQKGSQSLFINAWWEGEANPFKSNYEKGHSKSLQISLRNLIWYHPAIIY